MREKNSTPVALVCENCAGEFILRACDYREKQKRGHAKYCSRPCTNAGRKKAADVALVCEQCDEAFTRKRSTIAARRGPIRYCSPECAKLAVTGWVGMPDTTLAYVAGLFDGEGNLTIAYIKHSRHPNKQPQHSLRLSISNTDKAALDWLRATFGLGCVSVHQYNRTTGRTCYAWLLTNANAERLLVAMLPYLHIKRPQAELVIAYRREYARRVRTITPEMLARRDGYRNRLLALNGWAWNKVA